MPQVASDPSSVVASFSPPTPAPRPAPWMDPAPVTPFESMLDSTQASADSPPPPPPPAADRSDTPDAGDAPPKTVDSKPAVRANGKARDGTTTNANADTSGAADDAPQVDAKPSVNSGKTVTAKVKADADAIDTGKPADGKPSDAKSADKTVVDAPASNATPANPPDLAIAAAIAPAADAAAPQAAAATQAPAAAIAATVTIALPGLAVLKASLAKGDGSAKAQDATKGGDAKADAKSDAKPETADPSAILSDDGKPQGVAATADKTALIHPHDELPAHHADTADVTANADAAVANVSTAAQPLTLAAPTAQTAAAQAPAAPAPQAAAVPIAGIAIEIASKALAGKNRFDIRLDPPELGRIDVRLDVDKNGQVTSHLTVDRADTLDLLRRNSAGLERALQDAGLKTSDNGLQFSLRDQSQSQQQSNAPTPGAAQLVVEDDAFSAAAGQRGYARYAGMGSGIDIRV